MTILELLPNLFYSLISLILSFISLILVPIDLFIARFLPDLSNLLTYIGDLLTIISTALGWVISLTGLPPIVISLVVSYYVFSITSSLTIYAIKLAVKWYHRLKV